MMFVAWYVGCLLAFKIPFSFPMCPWGYDLQQFAKRSGDYEAMPLDNNAFFNSQVLPEIQELSQILFELN